MTNKPVTSNNVHNFFFHFTAKQNVKKITIQLNKVTTSKSVRINVVHQLPLFWYS